VWAKLFIAAAMCTSISACADMNILPSQENSMPTDIQRMIDENGESKKFIIYKGQYLCGQGTTGITLQIIGSRKNNNIAAIFKFYPLESNIGVSSGSYIVEGKFEKMKGHMDFEPSSWITHPFGYTMVGLQGISTDGGRSFDGTVTGSLFSCSTFSIYEVN
jgi:hypothetical protein